MMIFPVMETLLFSNEIIPLRLIPPFGVCSVNKESRIPRAGLFICIAQKKCLIGQMGKWISEYAVGFKGYG